MKYLSFLCLALLVTVGGGCVHERAPLKGEMDLTTASSTEQQVYQAMMDKMMSRSVPAGERIVFKDADQFKPGEVELRFTLYGQDGLPLSEKELKVVHERRLHLLLVRDDLTEYQHLHPEYQPDGFWMIKTRIPKQGTYQVYMDIAPNREVATVLRAPIVVGGRTQKPMPPTPTPNLTTNANGYRLVLSTAGQARAMEMKDWTFTISKDGQPVQEIQPYLGAYGHVVQLKHGDEDGFFHVHPVTSTLPMDGKVLFMGLFPSAGRYTLFPQFKLNDVVETFPLTLDVVEGSSHHEGMDHSGM